MSDARRQETSIPTQEEWEPTRKPPFVERVAAAIKEGKRFHERVDKWETEKVMGDLLLSVLTTEDATAEFEYSPTICFRGRRLSIICSGLYLIKPGERTRVEIDGDLLNGPSGKGLEWSSPPAIKCSDRDANDREIPNKEVREMVKAQLADPQAAFAAGLRARLEEEGIKLEKLSLEIGDGLEVEIKGRIAEEEAAAGPKEATGAAAQPAALTEREEKARADLRRLEEIDPRIGKIREALRGISKRQEERLKRQEEKERITRSVEPSRLPLRPGPPNFDEIAAKLREARARGDDGIEEQTDATGVSLLLRRAVNWIFPGQEGLTVLVDGLSVVIEGKTARGRVGFQVERAITEPSGWIKWIRSGERETRRTERTAMDVEFFWEDVSSEANADPAINRIASASLEIRERPDPLERAARFLGIKEGPPEIFFTADRKLRKVLGGPGEALREVLRREIAARGVEVRAVGSQIKDGRLVFDLSGGEELPLPPALPETHRATATEGKRIDFERIAREVERDAHTEERFGPGEFNLLMRKVIGEIISRQENMGGKVKNLSVGMEREMAEVAADLLAEKQKKVPAGRFLNKNGIKKEGEVAIEVGFTLGNVFGKNEIGRESLRVEEHLGLRRRLILAIRERRNTPYGEVVERILGETLSDPNINIVLSDILRGEMSAREINLRKIAFRFENGSLVVDFYGARKQLEGPAERKAATTALSVRESLLSRTPELKPISMTSGKSPVKSVSTLFPEEGVIGHKLIAGGTVAVITFGVWNFLRGLTTGENLWLQVQTMNPFASKEDKAAAVAELAKLSRTETLKKLIKKDAPQNILDINKLPKDSLNYFVGEVDNVFVGKVDPATLIELLIRINSEIDGYFTKDSVGAKAQKDTSAVFKDFAKWGPEMNLYLLAIEQVMVEKNAAIEKQVADNAKKSGTFSKTEERWTTQNLAEKLVAIGYNEEASSVLQVLYREHKKYRETPSSEQKGSREVPFSAPLPADLLERLKKLPQLSGLIANVIPQEPLRQFDRRVFLDQSTKAVGRIIKKETNEAIGSLAETVSKVGALGAVAFTDALHEMQQAHKEGRQPSLSRRDVIPFLGLLRRLLEEKPEDEQ